MKINYVFKRIIIVSKRILLIILILSLFQMIFLPRLLFADTSIEKIKLTNKYCQSSVPWENDILGNNTDPHYNISMYGCFVTSLAMIYNYHYPGYTDPGDLNKRLTPNGFESGSGNLNWKYLAMPIGMSYKKGSVGEIDQQLLRGNPVLAEIPGPLGKHAVVIIGKENNFYIIIDPLDGKERVLKEEIKKVHFFEYEELFDLKVSQEETQSGTLILDWFKKLGNSIVNTFNSAKEFIINIFSPDTHAEDSTVRLSSAEEQKAQSGEVTVTEVSIPTPSSPSLLSPYNWYQSLGGAPTLIWKGDENSVSYYVIVNSSNTGDIKSGWISLTSWKPNLPNENYIYSWKVKAKNSQGVESEWSNESHFSVASTTLKFEGNISFSPPSPSSADQIKIFASTTGWGGIGVTLRVSVNTAPDGSSNGEWRILKELGVPKFNEVDAPEWNTTGWPNGTYRIRIEAKGPDDPDWENLSVTETTYTLIGKENTETETNSVGNLNIENKIDYYYLSATENLFIYKSYDDQNDKNVFIIMDINETNKKIIYLDNFIVDYGKIVGYGESKYSLKDANSPFLSSNGRFIICNEAGTWFTHMLDINKNSLKTFEYIDENNELNSGSIRRDPCFSPNVNVIALGGMHSKYTDFSVQLCTFLTNEIENANLKVLTGLNSSVGDPRFSPDGSKIIFSAGNDEIIIIDSDGSNMFNFMDKFDYRGSHPAFSPDGSKIVFMYSDPNHQPYSIATVNLDGTDFKEIYIHEQGRCESPSFSSDGARVIFCAPSGDSTGHYRDIFSIDLQGNNLVNLTNSDKIDDCEPECIY